MADAPSPPSKTPQEILDELKKKKEDITALLQDVAAGIEVLEPITKELSPIVSEYEVAHQAGLGDKANLQTFLDTTGKKLEAIIPVAKQNKAKEIIRRYTDLEAPILEAKEKTPRVYTEAKDKSEQAQQAYNALKNQRKVLDEKLRAAMELRGKIDTANTKKHEAKLIFFLLELQHVVAEIDTLLQRTPEKLKQGLEEAALALEERRKSLREAELAKNKAEKAFNELPKRHDWILKEIGDN